MKFTPPPGPAPQYRTVGVVGKGQALHAPLVGLFAERNLGQKGGTRGRDVFVYDRDGTGRGGPASGALQRESAHVLLLELVARLVDVVGEDGNVAKAAVRLVVARVVGKVGVLPCVWQGEVQGAKSDHGRRRCRDEGVLPGSCVRHSAPSPCRGCA